jgi:hypothetical protein
VENEKERLESLIGDKQRRITMDGGEQVGRRLYFLDSRETEGEGAGEAEEEEEEE